MISSPVLKKWLAIGTGVGVEISGDQLNFAIVRVRPQGITVVAELMVEGFRERPAAVWGADIFSFLKAHGVAGRPLMVVLPNQESFARTVSLRGVAKKDIPSALSFQMEGLHPYGEGEAATAWMPANDQGEVLVGISRNESVEHYSALFAEAGLPLAGMTIAPVAIRAALTLRAEKAPDFLAFEERESATYLYGENSSSPIFWAVMDLPAERALTLARAQMRLTDEAENLDLAQLLPNGSVAAAAALMSACSWLTPSLNLLPETQRTTHSPWTFVPTAVLAVLLAVVGIALAGFDKYADTQLLNALDQEIRKVVPQSQKAAQAEKDRIATQTRIDLLKDYKNRTKSDLDALMETTKLIAAPAWVSRLDLTRTNLALSGEAAQAAELLKVLDASQNFRSSEFMAPLTRSKDSQMDVFQIRAARKDAKK